MNKTKVVRLRVGSEFLEYMRRTIAEKGCAEEVVMAVRGPGGKFLVAGKSFYPPGTLRLLSGGVEPGESPREALQRELREETGFCAEGAELLGTIRYRIEYAQGVTSFTSHVFLVPEQTGVPRPSDENEQLTDFQDVGLDELKEIAARLRSLPDKWADWGKFRAEAVEYIAESLD